MKEDKENTRPKENKVEIRCEDAEKTEKPKEKKEAMTKVKLASDVSYRFFKWSSLKRHLFELHQFSLNQLQLVIVFKQWG